jgi:hypothetical protein
MWWQAAACRRPSTFCTFSRRLGWPCFYQPSWHGGGVFLGPYMRRCNALCYHQRRPSSIKHGPLSQLVNLTLGQCSLVMQTGPWELAGLVLRAERNTPEVLVQHVLNMYVVLCRTTTTMRPAVGTGGGVVFMDQSKAKRAPSGPDHRCYLYVLVPQHQHTTLASQQRRQLKHTKRPPRTPQRQDQHSNTVH